MRIISLLPSATEIICQLGLESSLVGVSHECDYPDGVKQLPRLTSSNIHVQADTKTIHDSVESLLQTALTVYDLDMDLFDKLKPDWVVTQDLCDVCAVSLPQVEEACKKFSGANTKIISLHPGNLNDIWADIKRVAETLGVEQAYSTFKQDVDLRIKTIRDRIASASVQKQNVLTIEWLAPVMIGGLWVPEMIEIAGGNYLLASPGVRAQTVNFEQLQEINPNVVLIKPCGFDLQKTVQEFDSLKTSFLSEKWNATKTKSIYCVDGNTYFNRPGPRIIDSLEILAACAHPDLFPEFIEKYSPSIQRIN